MNISRIALLSALISAPMFSMENATPKVKIEETTDKSTETTDKSTKSTEDKSTKTTEDKNLLKKLGGFILLPFAFATETTGNVAAFIADKTFLNALIGKITTKNPELIGKVVVLTAAATAALYIAYNAYNAQDVDADEDMIFED